MLHEMSYKDRVNYTLRLNEKRLRRANYYLTDQSPKLFGNSSNESLSNIEIVFAIITMRRNYPDSSNERELNYLTQITGRTLELLQNVSDSRSLLPFVCNVDRDPGTFPEASKLRRHLRVIDAYSGGRLELKQLNEEEPLSKEKDDYVFCLETGLRLWPQASYVILIEDDSMPINSFIADIWAIIRQLKFTKKRDNVSGRNDVAFVKLYHGEQLRKIPWLIQVVPIASTLGYGTVRLLESRIRSGAASGKFPWAAFSAQFCFWLLLFYCLGHSIFTQMRRVLTGGSVYLTVPESCCTPAVLFTTETAGITLDYLKARKARKHYAKDHMLDQLPWDTGLRAYQTDTNLVYHIGRYSTLRRAPVRTDA